VLPPVIREHIMISRIPLKVVTAPAVGVVLKAPPVLMASEHSVDYTCGRCGTSYYMPTRAKFMAS
jgi:hypothetical protein